MRSPSIPGVAELLELGGLRGRVTSSAHRFPAGWEVVCGEDLQPEIGGDLDSEEVLRQELPPFDVELGVDESLQRGERNGGGCASP